MNQINMLSVMSKVDGYAKSEKGNKKCHSYIKECRAKGKGVSHGGKRIITIEDMCEAANKFIEILTQTAQAAQLPKSVLDHFDSLTYSPPQAMGGGDRNNIYQIEIWFEDDLSRMSLLITSGKNKGERTGDGIDNIVSLFDTGYEVSKNVFGMWDGREQLGTIKSLKERDGKHFMIDAVNSFNRMWGKTYGVNAVIDADNEYYTRS